MAEQQQQRATQSEEEKKVWCCAKSHEHCCARSQLGEQTLVVFAYADRRLPIVANRLAANHAFGPS